jgi:hypothetical protein
MSKESLFDDEEITEDVQEEVSIEDVEEAVEEAIEEVEASKNQNGVKKVDVEKELQKAMVGIISKKLENTEGFLNQIKVKYGRVFCYAFDADEFYIMRPMRRFEFIKIKNDKQLDDFQKEDAIIKTCIVYPKDFEVGNLSAGSAEILAETILDISDFKNSNPLVEL